MKQRILTAMMGVVALVTMAVAGGVEVGRGTWYQHTAIRPAAETIGAGGTITADACGGTKRVTSTAARTTSTSNTFTAPSALLAGCEMLLVNVGAFAITLDNNANFMTPGNNDQVFGASDTFRVREELLTDGNYYWVFVSSSNN